MGKRLDARFRLVGFLPLSFFLVQAGHYWRYGDAGNLLWMCNVGDLLLAAGLFLGHRELIRAAAIWTIPGLAVWIRYVLLASGLYFSTTLAHVGGIIVGLIVLRRVRMDRIAWIYAFAWYLFMQIAARLTTSPELNVNVAHRIQPNCDFRARGESGGTIAHTSELIRAAPFETPLGYFAGAVIDEDLDPGMRVFELKLLDRALELYNFAAVETRA